LQNLCRARTKGTATRHILCSGGGDLEAKVEINKGFSLELKVGLNGVLHSLWQVT
jgi:hypothetical protein